jgi:hypothetical protein
VGEAHEKSSIGDEPRPPAPHLDGPLGSSGARPGPTPHPAAEYSPAEQPVAETQAEPEDDRSSAEAGTPAADQPAGAAKAEATATPTASSDKPTDAPATTAGAQKAEATATPAASSDKPADAPATTAGDEVKGVEDVPGLRVTRVLRHANPVRAARTAGRTTSAWARRPAGRLILPAVIGIVLLGMAGTAGAYLVPKALKAGPAPSASPGFPLEGAAPGLPAPGGPEALPSGPLPSALPSAGASGTPGVPGLSGGRPADALAGWAQQVGTRVGIPVVAVEAYGYAELVLSRTAPACHLSWTTIAAIGFVESAHGSANNSVLNADGTVRPPIYGLPLDGKGGRQLIRDTDHGVIDGDTTYDRAVGPLQFIPSTWLANAIDADNNGVTDPNDLDDASLTAASYLCKNGRDLSRADSWYDAILSYNAVAPYAAKVYQTANEYGQRSRV